MASFDYCVDQALKGAKINKKIAEEIKQAQDPEAVIKDMVTRLSIAKREKVVDAIRTAKAIEYIESHPDGPIKGLQALLSKDNTGKAASTNVDYLQRVYVQQFASQWATGLQLFKTKGLGLFNNNDKKNEFVLAIYGNKVDDPDVIKAAEEYAAMLENMRVKFNEVGGYIPKNEKFLLPQNHDMKAVSKLTEDEYVAYFDGKLDRSQMVDDAGNVLDDKQLEEGLRSVYQTIISGGMNKAKGFTTPRGLGTKLSRRGSERRFIYFKDAESWIAYENEFGKGNILTTITDHIQSKAGDIALVEVLGTNPKNMYQGLKSYAAASARSKLQQDLLDKKVKKITAPKARLEMSLNMTDALYKTVSGEINAGEFTTLADGIQGVKSVTIAADLGGAILSSATDLFAAPFSAYYNGFSGTKVLTRAISNLKEQAVNGKEYRANLARMGFIVDTSMGRAHAGNRFADSYGTGWAAKVAEFVLRASGLEAWTQGIKKAFSMEFNASLVDNFNKSFDELSSVGGAFNTLQDSLINAGITRQDWDAFRKTKPMLIKGHKFADLRQDPSNKFHRMILQEGEFATPTIDARVQSVTTAGTQRGTVVGQSVRAITQITSYPISVMMQHWVRGMSQGTLGGKVGYLGAFAAGSTVLGAAGLQLSELSKGRELRQIDGQFVEDAFIRGGSGALIADALLVDHSRYGGGGPISTFLSSPSINLAEDVVDLTFGNVYEAYKGEETNVLGEGVKLVDRAAPGVWYTQLFMDSMFDQLRLAVDPNYQSTLNRMSRNRMREYNQEYWWAPGETPVEALSE